MTSLLPRGSDDPPDLASRMCPFCGRVTGSVLIDGEIACTACGHQKEPHKPDLSWHGPTGRWRNAHGIVQTIRGMCTDEAPHEEIDQALGRLDDIVYATTHAELDEAGLKRAADALRLPAQMGCTCPWDDDGNPPSSCACAQRAELERREIARRAITAYLAAPGQHQR